MYEFQYHIFDDTMISQLRKTRNALIYMGKWRFLCSAILLDKFLEDGHRPEYALHFVDSMPGVAWLYG